MNKFLVVLALLLTGCAAHKTVSNKPSSTQSQDQVIVATTQDQKPVPGKKPKPPRPPVPVDHAITMTWNQSFVNNNACSTTVTTSCISGFNEGYVVGTTQTELHKDVATVCTGATQPLNCVSNFNGLTPIGNVIFYITTTYVDQNGVAGVTIPAFSAAVPVGADPSQNVKVTVGP